MNDVLANAPVSISAPVVARDSFSARPTSQKNATPKPNSSQAISATSTSRASGVQRVHVGQRQRRQRDVDDEAVERAGALSGSRPLARSTMPSRKHAISRMKLFMRAAAAQDR